MIRENMYSLYVVFYLLFQGLSTIILPSPIFANYLTVQHYSHGYIYFVPFLLSLTPLHERELNQMCVFRGQGVHYKLVDFLYSLFPHPVDPFY